MHDKQNSDVLAEKFWRDFYILTQEMERFLKKEDLDMFFRLLDQRLHLQKKLEKLNNKTYHETEDGQKLLRQINQLNIKVQALAQSWLIAHRNISNKIHSYDGAMSFSGNFFNQKM